MRGEPNIATVAALIGDPARAAILLALADVALCRQTSLSPSLAYRPRRPARICASCWRAACLRSSARVATATPGSLGQGWRLRWKAWH